MIGASIYGFVDYKQTSQKKEFTNMYSEEKVKEPLVVITEEKKEIKPVVNKEVVIAKSKKSVIKRKAVKEKEEAIVPVKPITEDLFAIKDEVKIEEASVTITASKENNIVKKKKKKLNTKLFSRAPLKEDVDEELPVKKESKKIKEQ
jgi:hypothetical protein